MSSKKNKSSKSAEYYVGKGLKKLLGVKKAPSGPKRVKAPSNIGRKIRKYFKELMD